MDFKGMPYIKINQNQPYMKWRQVWQQMYTHVHTVREDRGQLNQLVQYQYCR